jgi:hypothetical protein
MIFDRANNFIDNGGLDSVADKMEKTNSGFSGKLKVFQKVLEGLNKWSGQVLEEPVTEKTLIELCWVLNQVSSTNRLGVTRISLNHFSDILRSFSNMNLTGYHVGNKNVWLTKFDKLSIAEHGQPVAVLTVRDGNWIIV